METYSAFANTEGGLIIFGVREKNGIFSVDPLSAETVDCFKKKFFDLQHDKERSSIALLTDKDIIATPYNDGFILAFYVPRASRDQRPVYVGLDPMETTYRRDHEGDYICDRPSVARMFAERENILTPPPNLAYSLIIHGKISIWILFANTARFLRISHLATLGLT